MEKSTSSGKDKEFGVTLVLQKVLSNIRVMDNKLRRAVCLAGTGKIRAVLKRMRVSDRPGNKLLNTFL